MRFQLEQKANEGKKKTNARTKNPEKLDSQKTREDVVIEVKEEPSWQIG
jgi:hypothetical protein